MFGNPRLTSRAQPTQTANPTRKNLSHQALAWSLGGPRFDIHLRANFGLRSEFVISTSGSPNRPTYPKIEMKKKTHRIKAGTTQTIYEP